MKAPEKSTVEDEATPRSRLLDAVAQAVTSKGYAQATIADVVRIARVSKRTFYEHFADKEECFLAAYRALSERLLAEMTSAAVAEQDVEERLRQAAQSYVSFLEERPLLTRTFLSEIQAAGPKALKLRREIQRRFVDFLCVMVEAARRERPELSALSPAMATALVGGINELLMQTVEDKKMRMSDVGETAVQLLRAVLTAHLAVLPDSKVQMAQTRRRIRRTP